MPSSTEKKAQFITMVQTGLLVHYIKKAGDKAPGYREWAIDHLEEAYRVADIIPFHVTPADAAKAFLNLVLMDITPEERKHLPEWLVKIGGH
jgi:hypothetical protein